MKLGVFIKPTALLHYSLPGASQTITFSGEDVALKEIFVIIKTQTGVFFFYDTYLLQYAKPVTFEWKNVTLETALNETFKNQPLTISTRFGSPPTLFTILYPNLDIKAANGATLLFGLNYNFFISIN